MLQNIRVTARAVIFFGLLGLVTLVLGVFALTQLRTLTANSQQLGELRIPQITDVGILRREFLLNQLYVARLATASTAEQINSTNERIAALFSSFDDALKPVMNLAQNEQSKQALAKVASIKKEYNQAVGRLQSLYQSAQIQAAHQLTQGQINDLGRDLTFALNDVIDAINQDSASTVSDSVHISQRASTSIVVALVVALISMVIMAWIFSRSIIQPLHRAVTSAQRIATGDLSQPLIVTGKDETADLMTALSTMQQQLHDTIHKIADSSQQLATTSEQLSVVTNDASKIMQEQNAQLEQAATAINEMTVAVDEVAGNASHTSENSQQVNQKAGVGQQKLQETMQTIQNLAADIQLTSQEMTALANNVKDIGQVLVVIRSIAEQTNLLALNAAIEAARAGEHGRGFAVVADEVRNLSQRTATATTDIDKMISSVQAETNTAVEKMNTSTDQVAITLSRAAELEGALTEITALVAQINEQNLNIASAAEEQAMVAREVDKNLITIRDLSFQTSTGAHETHVSSQELARLAEDLNGLLKRFKL